MHVYALLLCSAERLKLEKDYLELQSKAFAAPGSALAEVRPNSVHLRHTQRQQQACVRSGNSSPSTC
jgi:hypothetical protein